MNLWESIYTYFMQNNVQGAITFLEEYLSNQDPERFSCLLEEQFVNSPISILTGINRFIRANEDKFAVKAIYLEMNEFDINYDRWYFDLFAYSTYSPKLEDTEWICNWQSDRWANIELNGMNKSREAFAWYHQQRIWETQPELASIYDASMLLIMEKFAGFIGNCMQDGLLYKPVPVLVSAHGFETIAKYD